MICKGNFTFMISCKINSRAHLWEIFNKAVVTYSEQADRKSMSFFIAY